MITKLTTGWSRQAPIQQNQMDYGTGAFGVGEYTVIDPTRASWMRALKPAVMAMSLLITMLGVAHGDSLTPNFSFTLPAVGVVDPVTPWGTKNNNDWTSLDTLLGNILTSTGGFKAGLVFPAGGIPATGVTAGTYGSATQVSSITVGADGRITSAVNVGITPTAASILAGSLGSSVIASSLAVASVVPSVVAAGTYSNITLPAANVVSGALGSGVIASSIAVGAISATNMFTTGVVVATTVANNTLTNTQVAAGTFSSITIPAANVAAGSLGNAVIASSVAAVTTSATCGNAAISCGLTFGSDGRIISVSSNTIVPTGSVAYPLDLKTSSNTINGYITASTEVVTGSVTIQGNAFSVGSSTFIVGTEPTLIVSGANVGIGTNNPAVSFQVHNTLPTNDGTIFARFKRQALSDSLTISDLAGPGAAVAVVGTNTVVSMGNTNNGFSMLTTGRVGIGTSLPAGTLQVTPNATVGTNGHVVEVDSANAVALFAVNGNGIFVSSSAIPTAACNAGTPTLSATATNNHGTLTAGTGAANCTVTFSGGGYSKTPDCLCADATSSLALTTTVNTTSLTCTASTTMSGATIVYMCMGAP